jgi:hypothetical protein
MFAGTENFRIESLTVLQIQNVAVFFRGIRATVLSLFREIFFNKIPFHTLDSAGSVVPDPGNRHKKEKL